MDNDMNNNMDNNEFLQLALSEMRAISSEIKAIKGELEATNSEIKAINGETKAINGEIKAINDRLDSVETNIEDLKQGQAKLETDITEVKERIIVIENDHGQQLRALFDSYQLLYEISGDIRSNIGKMQAEQEKHELYIKWLDSEKKKSG